MTNKPLRVGIYLRISRDAEGKALGVDRQREDCLKRAEGLGWTVVDYYPENDVSASTISKKPRPQYDRLKADVESGRIDAILAYSASRLSRRPADWLDLIGLAERTGVYIDTIVSGRADFTTADGRAVAMTIAVWDAAEAERTQERVVRKHQELRDSGAMVGARSFGFAVDEAGRLTGEHVTEEARLIKNAARRITKESASPFTIAREWNDRGVRTARGGTWTHSNLRILLTNPKVAGYRVHRKQVVLDAHGQPVKGQWKPILTEKTWREVCDRFEQKRRGRPGAVKHMLGGMVFCECGGVMWGAATTDSRSGNPVLNLQCGKCRTAIAQHRVLPLVERAVAAEVLRTAGPEARPGGEAHSDVSARLRDFRMRRQRLLDLVDEQDFTMAEVRSKKKVLDEAIEKAEAELDALASRDVLGYAVAAIRKELGKQRLSFTAEADARKQVREIFQGLPLEAQQTLVRGTLKVTVKKAGRGSRMTAEERVTVVRINLDDEEAA